MSENVFVGADSFRRLLLGAAGGYELQGRHEAAETVRLYCEKRRKAGCCESRIFNKGNKGPLCPLYGSPMGWDGFRGKENG